ncbi:MAG: hypothetical protein WAO08_04945, partial [Hyphomicrobiaceae bacterium]
QILLDPAALEMDAEPAQDKKGYNAPKPSLAVAFHAELAPRIPARADANPSISPRPQAALAITVGHHKPGLVKNASPSVS